VRWRVRRDLAVLQMGDGNARQAKQIAEKIGLSARTVQRCAEKLI